MELLTQSEMDRASVEGLRAKNEVLLRLLALALMERDDSRPHTMNPRHWSEQARILTANVTLT
jgi:hypothetical protein